MNPVQRFALYGGLCIAGLSLTLAFANSFFLEGHMREEEWITTAEVVRFQVEEHQLASYLTDPARRQAPAGDRNAFQPLLSLPEVVRIKLWDREATVLWSDDERLIGKRFPENPEVRQALAGRVIVTLKTLHKAEQQYEREQFTKLAEIYVPIRSKTSGEILGVIEVYKLPARLFATIRRMRLVIWGIAASGGVLLYVVLLPIVRHAYRKQLELEASLREHAQELEVALRAKSEFLANMSHELRTPLNAVLGFAELLHEQTVGSLTERQARYVQRIRTSGGHLLALIRDLLDLSTVETKRIDLRPEPFPLPEALAVAVAEIRPQAEAKGLDLTLRVDEGLSTITADPIRFHQILSNLLSNAVKFTPTGGSITLCARKVTGPGDQESGAGRQPPAPGPCLKIRVTDTGIGIRAEDMPKLFRPLTQLEPVFTKHHQGTGLGLALTKSLVELHGGRIWAESQGEGRGSTLTVLLPLAGPPQSDKGTE